MIDLATCTTVKSADLKARKRHSFEISTPEITFLMYADTEKEKDDWIGNVGKAIVQCSRTFYTPEDMNNSSNLRQDQLVSGGSGEDPMLSPDSQLPSQQYQHLFRPYGEYKDDDDDIYTNDDPNNPYFND
jgi:hypothetical protein